jgi:hypothetical protein
MGVILDRCWRIARSWRIMNDEVVAGKLEEWALILEARSAEQARLEWNQPTAEPRPGDGVLNQPRNDIPVNVCQSCDMDECESGTSLAWEL